MPHASLMKCNTVVSLQSFMNHNISSFSNNKSFKNHKVFLTFILQILMNVPAIPVRMEVDV